MTVTFLGMLYLLACDFYLQTLKETEESQKQKIEALENEIRKSKQVGFFVVVFYAF